MTDTEHGTTEQATEHTVRVPDAGEGIAEVELVSWAVEIGDTVTRHQVVAEVMTDKATIEVPAPMSGVLSDRAGDVGEILLVGSDLFTLRTGDSPPVDPPTVEAPSAPAPSPVTPSGPEPAVTPTPVPAASAPVAPAAATSSVAASPAPSAPATPSGPAAAPQTTRPVAPRPEGRRPTATPAVRRRAREAGIDLRRVAGTGPAGRITHADLDAAFHHGGTAAASTPGPATVGEPGPTAVTDEPIVGLRRRIAERMITATTTIPHITYVEEVDVTELERLRATLNERRRPDQPKLTILPFLIRAVVGEVARHPIMNAHVLDPDPAARADQPDGAREPATLRSFEAVHVGIATQTETGLIVPVLRDAQALDLWQAAAGIAEMAEATRTGRASPADLSGSTITITSLGALGGIVTTPVINKPEVAIVGVNKIVTRPVWIDGQFVPRQMMNLSSSFDHRVVDGWDAAQFVQGLRAGLEQPALLFLDDDRGRTDSEGAR